MRTFVKIFHKYFFKIIKTLYLQSGHEYQVDRVFEKRLTQKQLFSFRSHSVVVGGDPGRVSAEGHGTVRVMFE